MAIARLDDSCLHFAPTESLPGLSRIDIVDFDYTSSEKAGDIINQLPKEGKLIDIKDIFIASIALSRNLKLITRNIKHFSGIPQLKVEKW